MSKPIITVPLTSTLAHDKVLAQHAKVMAQVDQTLATSNAIIDQAFHKANRAIEAARAQAITPGRRQRKGDRT